jgi:hypothetical protein
MKNINKKFFNDFTFNLDGDFTLNYISTHFINKALNKFFKNLEKDNLTNTQIIGIIMKIVFNDGSIKSLSTFRKGTIKNKVKFLTLFKHLLSLRSDDYTSDDLKATKIIFSYHIYPTDYKDNDMIYNFFLTELESKNKKEKIKDFISYKEDNENNIKYMDPLKLFKIPLTFLGFFLFDQQFNELNKNCSTELIQDDYRIKYKIDYKIISTKEVKFLVSLQEDPSIVVYKIVDKLITVPKLDEYEILIERKIMGRNNEVYLIDLLTSEILLINKRNIKAKTKGYISYMKNDINMDVMNLKKFITFDIEAETNLDDLRNEGDAIYFTPIVISAFDFYMDELSKYCLMDSIALAYVIDGFAQRMFDKFKINIHKYPTISSVAMAIFLTDYLKKDDLILLVTGQMYRDIRKAFHGGHTDVYTLYSNEEVYSYDYSSMYPTQMLR